MTTVVPKLSKPDSVPFKALKPARAEESSSSSFARALEDADSSKAAVRQAAEPADNSVQLPMQTVDVSPSIRFVSFGDEATRSDNGAASTAGNGSAGLAGFDSATKNVGESTGGFDANAANFAGVAGSLVGLARIPAADGSSVLSLGTAAVQTSGPLSSAVIAKELSVLSLGTAAVQTSGALTPAVIAGGSSLAGAIAKESSVLSLGTAAVQASGALTPAVIAGGSSSLAGAIAKESSVLAIASDEESLQGSALWANGSLKGGTRGSSSNVGLSSPSDGFAGRVAGMSADSTAISNSIDVSPLSVLSTTQGSIVSHLVDPSGVVALSSGIESTALSDGSAVFETGGAISTLPPEVQGGQGRLGGASWAVQETVQTRPGVALLNAGLLEVDVSEVASAGQLSARAASGSGAVSVASALAAASVTRTSQPSALSDSTTGLSTTVGSITGTLSVPMMSGSAGADLGGSALGTQTGGAGSESGGSSGGSRNGSSNSFMVQAATSSEPSGVAASAGALDISARSSLSVGLGSYANATATVGKNSTTNVARVVEDSPNQSPALDVNTPVTEAAVASDPRAAWRDLRSKWDQPIRANAPKG